MDYAGTRAPFYVDPRMASLSDVVLKVLSDPYADSANKAYIVSGMDSVSLQQWLGHLRVGLIAEHGVKIRH